MKETLYIIGLFVAFILIATGIGKEVLKETPNERVERINRNADRECGVMQDVMARNCYAWYYEQIEDRD